MSFKRKFLLDNVLGTAFIFALMGLIFGVSQFNIFNAFDPVGEALADMELTDVVFSQLREDPEPDTNIVVVNIGPLPRGMIGEQIRIISQYQPKVIGIDSFFSYPHDDDPEGDSVLSAAIANAEKVVMVTKLLQSDSLFAVQDGEDIYDSLEHTYPDFRIGAIEAFANLSTEAEFQEDFKACRSFPPRRYVNGERYLAFSVQMAEIYDSLTTQKFLERDNPWETINYRGNIVDFFGRTQYPNSFFCIGLGGCFIRKFSTEHDKRKSCYFWVFRR